MSAPPARLGVPDRVIMFRHVLPNAMVATLTMLPFVVTGAIGSLATLDFLGFGLPANLPSLGRVDPAGQAEPANAVAGLHRLFHLCHHAVASGVHLRGHPRRL
ncbi:MAG: ABC transporter permease subunit [Cypionkella sp.]